MLLDDIIQKLIDDGIAGGATGWAVYIATEPANAIDQLITIYDTPGDAPVLTFGGNSVPMQGYMIRVRGAKLDYATARAKIMEVAADLHFSEISSVTSFVVNSAPIPLGNDEQDRPILTINFATKDVNDF